MTHTKKRSPSNPRKKPESAPETLTSSPPAVPTAVSTIPEPATPPQSVPPKTFSFRKRVRIGEALRKSGVDEWRIAGGYADVMEKLTKNGESNDSVEKLLVDVLKECSRHLEPPRSLEAAADTPVSVKLVHTVSRPSRTPTSSS